MKLIDKVRVFDPLKPSDKNYNLVFHLPICLDSIERRQDGSDRDFRCLQFQMENFKKIPASDDPNFKMLLIISVNGFMCNQGYVDYLSRLPKQLTPNIDVIVFQRPNVGWQWGGFHDVFMRYKENSEYFITCECDVYPTVLLWYNRILSIFESHKNIGYVGMEPKICMIDTADAYGEYEIPKRLWRDRDNKIIRNTDDFQIKTKGGRKIKNTLTTHSRGGWYFCKRELLKSMDNTYGCFTFSMGSINSLDGIVMGEIGFAHKTAQLGFNWECTTFFNVFEGGEI